MKSDHEANPTALRPIHRGARDIGGRGLDLPCPHEHRRVDQLRDHPRDQHGAAVSHRRPGAGQARRPLQRRGDRRLPQHGLHTVVLHRIIARQGNRYVFKGDNNNFVDPDPPSRAQLIGALWVHLPHAGRVLALLHTPLAGGLVAAVVALLLLVGVKETRRRRNRRRGGATGSGRQGPPPVKTPNHGADRHINFRALLIACAVAAAAFLALGVFSFTRPLRKATTVSVPYTQAVSFSYQAKAPAGPVYPDGVVHSGDPIFLQLVHRVRVRIDYHFVTSAPHRVAGSEAVLLRLTGPGGWSRTTADRFTTTLHRRPLQHPGNPGRAVFPVADRAYPVADRCLDGRRLRDRASARRSRSAARSRVSRSRPASDRH